MNPTLSRGIALALLVALTAAACPDGLSWCQDPFKGILCYNSTYTSCVLDSNLRSYTLCGVGLESCGGVCFHPQLNSCNNSVLVAPTVVTVFTISAPPKTSSDQTTSNEIIMSTQEQEQNDTTIAPSTWSPSTTSRQPVNSNFNIPPPNAGPGGAPPRYQPPTSASTSSVEVSKTSSEASTTSTTARLTSSKAPTTSTTAHSASSTTSRQPVNSNWNIPAPNAGPGGAPPRYVPPTITESM